EGAIREALGDRGVGDRRLRAQVQGGGQELVWLSVRVDLDRRRAGVGETVGPWEPPEEVVEAPVLEVDDDDVLDLAEALGTLRVGRHDPEQDQHDGRERDAGQPLPLDTSHGDASVHSSVRAGASSYRARSDGAKAPVGTSRIAGGQAL